MRPNIPPVTSTATSITVQCRMFGRYAELLASEGWAVTLPVGATAGDMIAEIRATHPGAEHLPVEPLIAVNRRHVKLGASLEDGDEVALLPPLAGG